MTRPYRRQASYDVDALDLWSPRAYWLQRLLMAVYAGLAVYGWRKWRRS